MPTISDMMLDNTRSVSNKVPCTEISKSTRIPQFLDNPKLSKIWMYGKCLIASTKAKHTILNEYNAKFEGKFVRSTTTKKKGELVSRCDTQFSTQRQLEQSSVIKIASLTLHHGVIILIKETYFTKNDQQSLTSLSVDFCNMVPEGLWLMTIDCRLW